MNIAITAQKISNFSPQAVSKAEEYLRIARLRLSLNSNPPLNMALPAICLELATRSMNEPTQREQLQKVSGVNANMYQQFSRSIQSILKLDFHHSLSSLCVKFGCAMMKDQISQVFQQVHAQFLRAHAHRNHSTKKPTFDDSMLKAAVMCICCQHERVDLDTTELFELLNVQSRSRAFQQLLASIEKCRQAAPSSKPQVSNNNVTTKHPVVHKRHSPVLRTTSSTTPSNLNHKRRRKSMQQISQLIQENQDHQKPDKDLRVDEGQPPQTEGTVVVVPPAPAPLPTKLEYQRWKAAMMEKKRKAETS